MRKVVVIGLTLAMALSIIGGTAHAASRIVTETAPASFDKGKLVCIDAGASGTEVISAASDTFATGWFDATWADAGITSWVGEPNVLQIIAEAVHAAVICLRFDAYCGVTA